MASTYPAVNELTRQTLQQRSAQYKWLVIAITCTAITSLLTAVWSTRLAAVIGALLLPAIALFHALDQRAIATWRAVILAGWSGGEIDIGILIGMLKQVRGLPSHTLAGMIETLPPWPGEATTAQRNASIELRRGIEQAFGVAVWARFVALSWATLSIAAALLVAPISLIALAAVPAALWILRRRGEFAVERALADFDSAGIADQTATQSAITPAAIASWTALRRACFATPDIPRWLHVEHGPR
jgi:hypothetical protein